MPPPLSRISMTIPPDVLRKADRIARAWDRSRSWVIAEALRRLVDGAGATAGPQALVAEPAADPYLAAAAQDARSRHLGHALTLSPAQRLARATELAGMAPRRRGTRRQIIAFDSLEDFAQWKKARRAGA